jgi:SAM-dependent methyltransferase
VATQPLPIIAGERSPPPPPPSRRRRTPPLGMPLPPDLGKIPQLDITDPSVPLVQPDEALPIIESRRPPRPETTEPIRTGPDATLRRSAALHPRPLEPDLPRVRAATPPPPIPTAATPPPSIPAVAAPPPPPATTAPPPSPAVVAAPPPPPPAVTSPPPPPAVARPPSLPPQGAPQPSRPAPPPVPADKAQARPQPPVTTPPPVPAAGAPPPLPTSGTTPERNKRRRAGKQWFEEIFDEDYLRTLPFLTPRQTEQEVSFLVDSLNLQPGQRILDVGCGYGRHAMELASRGYRPVGIDLSLPLLIRAADAARRVGVNVDFVHGDMREMTFDGEFDAAYSVFTSFGYFDDETNRRVAAGICRALKPGARFVLDLINRDYLIGDLPTRVWWQGDGCVVLEEVDFNYFTSRLQVQRQIILEDGRQLEQEISIRTYSLHEIGKILHHAGFRVLEVSGGLSLRGRFFGAASRHLILLAEKRQPDS